MECIGIFACQNFWEISSYMVSRSTRSNQLLESDAFEKFLVPACGQHASCAEVCRDFPIQKRGFNK